MTGIRYVLRHAESKENTDSCEQREVDGALNADNAHDRDRHRYRGTTAYLLILLKSKSDRDQLKRVNF